MKYFPEVKAVEESFEGSGVLATKAKAGLQTLDFAVQLIKVMHQYEFLISLIEIVQSMQCRIKEPSQVNHGLSFEEDSMLILKVISQKECRKVTYPN